MDRSAHLVRPPASLDDGFCTRCRTQSGSVRWSARPISRDAALTAARHGRLQVPGDHRGVDRRLRRTYPSPVPNRVRERRTASPGVRSTSHPLAILAAFQNGASGGYVIAPRVLQLAVSTRERSPVRSLAQPVQKRLASERASHAVTGGESVLSARASEGG
jgi:hypothetical protein